MYIIAVHIVSVCVSTPCIVCTEVVRDGSLQLNLQFSLSGGGTEYIYTVYMYIHITVLAHVTWLNVTVHTMLAMLNGILM